MMCVEVGDVKTNLDEHKTVQPKPAKCLYQNGDTDACKYFYKDNTGKEQPLVDEWCQCSLMEEITDENKNTPVQEFKLPYSETGVMGLMSIPRDRIEQGRGYCPLVTQNELNEFVLHFKPLVKSAIGILHTNDRANL